MRIQCGMLAAASELKQQFLDIAVKICPKLKEEISRIIGDEVWKQRSTDIRDVISPGS